MKNLLLTLLFLSNCTFAQIIDYGALQMGKYDVSFSSITVFDTAHPYKAYGYDGKKPVFIKIWSPIKKSTRHNYLQVQDFTSNRSYKSFNELNASLEKIQKEIFVRDFISENLKDGNENSYGGISTDSIYARIMLLKTHSIEGLIPTNSKHHVIVYHHGSQSNAAENFMMAEYFASHGYIFVSADFHLPFENTVYGLKPFDQLFLNEEEANLRLVFNLAKSLSTNDKVYFIGHSLGSQMGFRTFDTFKELDGFVSLESTLEFKKDTLRIKELWPELYNKICIKKAEYPFPIMFCAASEKTEAFPFFINLKSNSKLYVSTKYEFEHDAYLSYFYLRYFLSKDIPQSDISILDDRFKIYVKHIYEMHSFFKDIEHGRINYKNKVKRIE